MQSFYLSRSQKHKNSVKSAYLFTLLGSVCVNVTRKILMKLTPVADPIKLIFFATEEFFRFAAKLGHFIINYFFPKCNKH